MAEKGYLFVNKSEDDQEVPGRQCEAAPGHMDNILCQPCLKKDKRTTAFLFCKTCNEFQCTVCSNVHEDFAFMENHELVEAKKADSLPRSYDMKGLDNCDKHLKMLQFFCEDEKLLCCSSCAIVDHRKCHSVVEIHSTARNSGSVNSELISKLQDIKAKAETVAEHTKKTEEYLDQDIKQIPLKIKRIRDDVIKMFDDLEVSFSETATIFQSETLKKLVKKQTTSEKHIADVKKCLETIDNVYQNGTPPQQFIVEHKLKVQVNELQTKVEETFRNIESVTVLFDFDETLNLPPRPITDYIPGRLTLKYGISDPVNRFEHEDFIMKLEKINSIDLKQTGNDVGEPLYTGLDFLPDGRLVVVDNENKKCLIFNDKLKKVGSCQLSYFPQSVVAVSDEEVAITSAKEYKIDIFRVSKSNEIILIRKCTVKTKFDSICLKDDGNFVVGTIDDTRPARIVSPSGEQKDFHIKFSNKKYPVGTNACTYIRNSQNVVITDRYAHAVCIYGISTNTRVVVKDDKIKEPRGVAAGPSDCILVCSRRTDSIVKITATGRILSSYKLEATRPFRVCFSQNKSILAVSTNQIGNMKLQLFKVTHKH